MTDKEFLTWIYQRLLNVYHEYELVDYMWRLRAIINRLNPELKTNIKTEDYEIF